MLERSDNYISWTAVSQIWALDNFIINTNATGGEFNADGKIYSRLNSLRVNLDNRLGLPTPGGEFNGGLKTSWGRRFRSSRKHYTQIGTASFKHKSQKKPIAIPERRSTTPDLLPCRLPAADRSHPPPAQPLNRYKLFILEQHRFLLLPKTALITWIC